MKTEVSLQVKSKFVNKFKNGYPLITKDSIINANALDVEGSTLKLVDEQNHFIAKGYYGKQNKGLGWVLSRKEKEQFNHHFFEKWVEIYPEADAHWYAKAGHYVIEDALEEVSTKIWDFIK